tara:strand:- start:2080 stop:2304 length:225 start_codon:yes stop_codon:yes gene_type:complete
MNYDDWKLASPPENDLVSYCCGSEYEEDTEDGIVQYKCYKCNDWFDEPEEEWEYNERQRENWLEMQADEDRLNK